MGSFQITAIDMDREAYEIGLPFIQNAEVEHKIYFPVVMHYQPSMILLM